MSAIAPKRMKRRDRYMLRIVTNGAPTILIEIKVSSKHSGSIVYTD